MDFATMKVLNIAKQSKTVQKLSKQLVGADYAKAMAILKGLTEEDLSDLAKYIEKANKECGTLRRSNTTAQAFANLRK